MMNNCGLYEKYCIKEVKGKENAIRNEPNKSNAVMSEAYGGRGEGNK
jgi:hypothetical protein